MTDPIRPPDDAAALVLRRAVLLRQFENAVESGVASAIRRAFDRLEALLLRQDPTAVSQGWQQARLASLLKRANAILTEGYREVHRGVTADLRGLGPIAAQRTAREALAVAGRSLDPLRLPSRRLLAAIVTTDPVQGAPLRAWWAQLGARAQLAVRREIQLGLTRRESIDQIVRRIRGRVVRTVGGQRITQGGVLDTTIREATVVARTAVNEVYNRSARLTLEENRDLVWGMEWVATLDERTCAICGPLDGTRWALDDPAQLVPPLHPNDRCTLVAVMAPGQRRRRQSYTEWFATLPPERQRRILGPGRFALYASGQLTLSDLITRDQRIRTLAELEAALA